MFAINLLPTVVHYGRRGAPKVNTNNNTSVNRYYSVNRLPAAIYIYILYVSTYIYIRAATGRRDFATNNGSTLFETAGALSEYHSKTWQMLPPAQHTWWVVVLRNVLSYILICTTHGVLRMAYVCAV